MALIPGFLPKARGIVGLVRNLRRSGALDGVFMLARWAAPAERI